MGNYFVAKLMMVSWQVMIVEEYRESSYSMVIDVSMITGPQYGAAVLVREVARYGGQP